MQKLLFIYSVLSICCINSLFAQLINVNSSFGNSPETEVNISWRIEKGTDNGGLVEYGASESYGKKTKASFIKSSGGKNFEAKLSGLKAGTVYHYRCGADGKWSGDCTFKTAPNGPEPFLFSVLGDVQGKKPSGLWRDASKWVAKRKPAFWIPVGDLVQHGMIQKEWDYFFSDAKGLCESSPIMPVIGNHDLYAADGKSHRPQLYLDQFTLPENGDPEYPEDWYYFEYGNAIFIMLNTYPATGDRKKDEALVRETQMQWMDKVLSENEAKWKFVFFHPPIYSSGGHGGDTLWLKDYWGKIFDKHHVNVVFTGHTHAFEVTHPIKAGKKVLSPKEGTIYYNTAGINYSGMPKGAWFTDVRQEKSRQPLVAMISVKEKQVDIITYNWRTGKTIHKLKIGEKND